MSSSRRKNDEPAETTQPERHDEGPSKDVQADACDIRHPDGIYTHGHHQSVLRAHRWRSAANSAAYLLARLKAGDSILDVGCGPGTITVDLAAAVAPGRVVGSGRRAGGPRGGAGAGRGARHRQRRISRGRGRVASLRRRLVRCRTRPSASPARSGACRGAGGDGPRLQGGGPRRRPRCGLPLDGVVAAGSTPRSVAGPLLRCCPRRTAESPMPAGG